jgi:hypothetical protein
MNDWGDYDRFVLAANSLGVPTFGKVEGAQDFEDVDVHWKRNAYRQVEHVLCQGDNDYRSTVGVRSVVGSSRLERIWAQPPTPYGERVALINLNFTYGVLDGFAEMWLESVIHGCKRAGVDYVISSHPAQRRLDIVAQFSSKPLRFLLTRPSILVSRFSTVPFEAMARGVPFIYHNPHNEKVPTFQEPDGAFAISRDSGELAEALAEARLIRDYRSVCREFFLLQVDIDEALASEERTAAILLET